ncbi:MAG TPA: indole-3-glycerol phosphate synthase TrpC [Candidatus Acidoferrum sp.]|jgi:indole-3-glycerol phosphate synthase|nr:indole-3-glycerol phosphate synthase TrpC [Candidatus Acidoferrum sp.]
MAEDVLKRIYAAKAERLKTEMEREPYDEIRERARASVATRRHFLKLLRARSGDAIVAEIKRASPSAGLIARDFDPVAIAKTYERAGADAISILTENDHFLGDLSFIAPVRAASALPLLRKDFLTTPYQVAQSAAYGADAILLIVSGLSDDEMRAAMAEAQAYELDALVEVHDVRDLQRALALGSTFVGVNNRNLRTMITDLAVSEHVLPQVPVEVFAISESGMRDLADLERLRRAGARGFLIGEALMRAEDPAALLASFKHVHAH